MKYLLQAIEAKRESVRLSDPDLLKLLVEVRNSRDEKAELFEAMERLLTELRNSEHSQAFHTKVSKRDAPDYYEIIKHPMDLGTMQRNVRMGKYKTKAQFARDLDLIWDNCLTYNSEPSHFLRRSAQIMRAKSNHLLAYMNDGSDVKDVLTQWQSSERFGAAAKGAEGTEKDGAAGKRRGSKALGRKGISLGAERKAAMNEPFEQRPALLRQPDAMTSLNALDEAVSALEETGEPVAGPSRQRIQELLRPALGYDAHQGPLLAAVSAGLEAEPEPDAAKVNGVQPHGDDEDEGNAATSSVDAPFGDLHAVLADDDEEEALASAMEQRGAGAALEALWWTAAGSSTFTAAGVPSLPASEAVPAVPLARRKRKRRRIAAAIAAAAAQAEGGVNGEGSSRRPLAGASEIRANVRTIQKLRHTHGKFEALAQHVEQSEDPLPAWLASTSSDEEDAAADEDEEEEEVEVQDDFDIDPADAVANPYSRISPRTAQTALGHKAQILLAHAGFEGSHASAANVLTSVAEEYMLNLGRTLRKYTDRYAHKMSAEEMLLHTLSENGGTDVRSLESYLVDDVARYGTKMTELLRKLRQSYKEQLDTSAVPMEDDAFFREDNDALVSGNFAQELGDDFFGFKAMGLDKELGLAHLAVPSRLLRPRSKVAARGPGVGSADDPSLQYPPPPPFVPMTEAGVNCMIGLLQPWYRDIVKQRGRWPKGQQQQPQGDGQDGPNGRAADAQQAQQPPPPPGMEDGADVDDNEPQDQGMILSDDEQSRRPKMPPTGKAPKRHMLGSANGASSAPQEKPVAKPAASTKIGAPPAKKGKAGR